ncbi:MAG: hypothetical protein JXA82_16950, partial [Sedimentisphaerales bacterium]|nr:hypothetical protein [Sedimentisphaerales bacterium]
MIRKGLILVVLCSSVCLCEPAEDDMHVPGTVIHYSPASSGCYLGSPGICILPNGEYLAKCDLFGPKSTEWAQAVSLVFRSSDRGKSWKQIARIEGLFWASIFVHREDLYLFGTHRHHGNTVILKSTDSGHSWTSPESPESGLLLQGEYHTAPVPVVVHDGRIWRAMEDAMGGTRWGQRYRAIMMSAPVNADLLRADSWTSSNWIARNPDWLDGRFGGWLEGNAVVTPEGGIVDILRVDDRKVGGQAAMIRISKDGKEASFDPATGFIHFPGANTKFTIRYDPKTKAYWSLTNTVPPRFEGRNKASIRNTLALIRSKDLKTWEIRCILLFHPDPEKHGFQYPDWLFEGEDIIAAIR